MKSHLDLSEPLEETVTFRDIKYYYSSKQFFVEVNGNTYTILHKDIIEQGLDVEDIKAYLDFLINKNKEYITITTPVDGVTKLVKW